MNAVASSVTWLSTMRIMNTARFGLLLTLLGLSGCLAATPAAPPAGNPSGPSPRIVGNDRDAHGCIPSAGYQWCEKTQQCERPWELAARVGFAPGADKYEAYCGSRR